MVAATHGPGKAHGLALYDTWDSTARPYTRTVLALGTHFLIMFDATEGCMLLRFLADGPMDLRNALVRS